MSRDCPDLATEDFLELGLLIPKVKVQQTFDRWCFEQSKKMMFGFIENSEIQNAKRERAVELLNLAYIDEKNEEVQEEF